jgi:hypothetical protein
MSGIFQYTVRLAPACTLRFEALRGKSNLPCTQSWRRTECLFSDTHTWTCHDDKTDAKDAQLLLTMTPNIDIRKGRTRCSAHTCWCFRLPHAQARHSCFGMNRVAVHRSQYWRANGHMPETTSVRYGYTNYATRIHFAQLSIFLFSHRLPRVQRQERPCSVGTGSHGTNPNWFVRNPLG